MKTAEEWRKEVGIGHEHSQMRRFIRAVQADALRWARGFCINRMNSYQLDSNFYEVIQELGKKIEDQAYSVENGEEEPDPNLDNLLGPAPINP